MDYRIEKDTIGEIKVPSDKYWGAQTQRSLENFRIGSERMPLALIRVFAVLKKSAALANRELGKLDDERAGAIMLRRMILYPARRMNTSLSWFGRLEAAHSPI